MCIIEKEIEKYLFEIQNNLVCSNKAKKNIISEIEGFVYDYAEVKGVTDISEIYEHFGTPEEMARTYLSQADPKKIAKAVRVKKAVIIGVIVALVMVAASLLISLMDAHKSHIGYVEKHYVETNTDSLPYYNIETELIVIDN